MLYTGVTDVATSKYDALPIMVSLKKMRFCLLLQVLK